MVTLMEIIEEMIRMIKRTRRRNITDLEVDPNPTRRKAKRNIAADQEANLAKRAKSIVPEVLKRTENTVPLKERTKMVDKKKKKLSKLLKKLDLHLLKELNKERENLNNKLKSSIRKLKMLPEKI